MGFLLGNKRDVCFWNSHVIFQNPLKLVRIQWRIWHFLKTHFEMCTSFNVTDSLFIWESLNLPYTVHILSKQKIWFLWWSSNQDKLTLFLKNDLWRNLKNVICLDIVNNKSYRSFSSNEIIVDCMNIFVSKMNWPHNFYIKILLYNISFWLPKIKFILTQWPLNKVQLFLPCLWKMYNKFLKNWFFFLWW